jgi:hypothetical protein
LQLKRQPKIENGKWKIEKGNFDLPIAIQCRLKPGTTLRTCVDKVEAVPTVAGEIALLGMTVFYDGGVYLCGVATHG